jgi:hypothetical protein
LALSSRLSYSLRRLSQDRRRAVELLSAEVKIRTIETFLIFGIYDKSRSTNPDPIGITPALRRKSSTLSYAVEHDWR